MQKLCSDGYKASSVDLKALSHYLLITPKKWATDALAGMKNKAVKTIMRDWLEVYKSKQSGNVSADIAVIIPGILAMDEFKPYRYRTPDMPIIDRKEPSNDEIWEGGFDIEDYEKMALEAFYSDPEAMLRYFMENKIYQRRKAMCKEKETEMLKDPEVTEMPAKQDDFINMVCTKPGYKNRADNEKVMVPS